jgi:hypothetical protein
MARTVAGIEEGKDGSTGPYLNVAQYLFRDYSIRAVVWHFKLQPTNSRQTLAYAILVNMNTVVLKSLLARVQTWPKGAQEEAVKALREIEEDFLIGPETSQELERSREEASRGEGIGMEELFSRYDL